MTEITADSVGDERIDPVAFGGALILGLVVFTAPFLAIAWLHEAYSIDSNGLMVIAVIPVAAAILGAIPYLAFGTPAFIMALQRQGSTAGAAFLANLCATPIAFAALAIINNDVDIATTYAGLALFFGSIFAPIWGAMFGWIYRLIASE